MLVLSRKLGEKIFIGDNICITVVDIDRGKIRLGIEAPRNVPIYRQELLPLNNPRPDNSARVPIPGPAPCRGSLPARRAQANTHRRKEPDVRRLLTTVLSAVIWTTHSDIASAPEAVPGLAPFNRTY